ncbi:hypothetical protein ODJ79_23200 [Actinoplanes sp. KI2]|uniref:hypothetical protein n=1 Tax=Actinoplanes sp. KI2 TaxID=2983315 RepID=UPI0021D5F904|nr:hypothetical protein [Actinoplanes sp. KI2]MCU7726650.1 hypothetical protein [Actinoplanes sp. KI2]
MTILVPQPFGPTGAVQPVPTSYPHGEMYYDASVEPIATCACGQYAATVCPQCRRYRCPACQPSGGPVCTECADTAVPPDAADRERRLGLVAQIPEPTERLLQAAMVLEDDPGDDLYAALYRVCPFLPFMPGMTYWEPLAAVFPPGPQWVPWDSGMVGRWFAARAAAQRLRPGFEIAEGRVFAQTAYGWRLLGGSTVREDDGFTDTAFVLTSGAVLRAVAPEERRPGFIATRRTEPTGLNLLALAELGGLLGLQAPVG